MNRIASDVLFCTHDRFQVDSSLDDSSDVFSQLMNDGDGDDDDGDDDDGDDDDGDDDGVTNV